MKEVDEQHCADLSEQLLTRLLIDGLNENKEGELILKNLNASMLRMLENCNHTYIFCVLFNHLRTYKDTKVLPKLPGLIIKCLLKLSKILEKLIDKLDMERVLLAIHEYMVSIDHDNKSSNDEMGIRIVKTVVNELVKLKRDQIWTAYRVVECHQAEDNHIKRWIKIILASLQNVPASEQPQAPSRQTEPDSQAQAVMTTKDKIADIELRKIIDDMRSTDGFD